MPVKRIILIRHGESHGNRDQEQYATVPDYTIELTERGKEQACQAGKILKGIVGDEPIYFYVSPFWRTRSTFEQIAKAFPTEQFVYSEEPRLREQEWGYLRSSEELKELLRQRREYGSFYFRFPGGEAATDVYDRINDFLGSLHRDMRNPDFPQNCVLVTHSLAIRLFIMRWFHLSVEDFEAMKSPKNAELVLFEYNPLTELYELKTPLESDPSRVLRSRPIRL